MQTHVQYTREGAEFYISHLSDGHAHVRLKALLCLRQIALKVAPFRQYLRACVSRMPSQDLLAVGCSPEAALLIHQARKNLIDLLQTEDAALEAKNALLASRCEGFGTRAVFYGPGDSAGNSLIVNNPISDFIAETVQEVADDFRSKGAVATLKDATIDVADLLVEGLEGLTGWMRQVLPNPPSTTLPAGPPVVAPAMGAVHDFSGYRQQGGDQFAGLFGEPSESRPGLVCLAQSVEAPAEEETRPNTPNTPELPALLLEKKETSFLD